MESIFRFLLRRPAVDRSDDAPSIQLAQDTPLQQALEQARAGSAVRADMKTAARQYVASSEFVGDYGDLVLGENLENLGAALDELGQDSAVNPATVSAAVEQHLAAAADVIAQGTDFQTDARRLRDSLLAIKLLPEEQHRPLHRLTQALRDVEIVTRVAGDPEFPQGPRQLRRFRSRSFELPGVFDIGSILRAPRRERADTDSAERQRRLETLLQRFRNILKTLDELTGINGDQLVQMVSRRSIKALPPTELRPVALLARQIDRGQLGIEHELATGAAVLRTTISGRQAFQPEEGPPGFRIRPAAVEMLSEETRNVLEERGLPIQERPLDELVDVLRAEVRELADEMDQLGGRTFHYSFKRFAGALLMIATPVSSLWTDIAIGRPGHEFPTPVPRPEDSIPSSHGDITPAGVADLVVVRQQIVRYEAADVAHIENVLKGERKQREHRRRRETEQLILRETEVTSSEERELESTDRFEMVRETSQTINEQATLTAGLTVSGKYGPSVEFSASTEGSLSRSREQSIRTASTFSKEITDRSATKISERVLQRESLRVTREVEDRNEHTLDNVAGDGHVRGVYQWVEKVYEAQMFNYGLRTMYDLMVPEPAAFLIETLRRAHTSATHLEKPMPFTLLPSHITEYNYQSWVREYGATDVSPPPEPYLTKSHDYSAGGGDNKADYYHSAQISIDEGYRAIHAWIGVVRNIWDDDHVVDVVIGRWAHRFEDGDWVWITQVDSERDSLPFAFTTNDVSDIAVAVEVKCQRTDHAMNKWRLDTHAKLTQAYRARLSEYQEQLAALEAAAGVAIAGQAPAANLELMKNELKKASISILTRQHFDLFDAVETGLNGLPQIDFDENEAEGPYVRFFEQAFEWEQMTWVTYPYYWGRKSEWANRIAFEDSDPLFNQFLKAGYCRVAVPVREGFEAAVDHFMKFGEPWVGGPLPTISDPLYLNIAVELAEQLDRPGNEVPIGEPWEVRLPTTLVRLRDDGSLPTWQKDAEGNWVTD